METRKSVRILRELKHHLPFTLIASLAAGILVSIFYLVGRVPSEKLFEIVHPTHVLVSALATSALYWRYEKSVWKTILVGVSGAIFTGSLSDVLLPFLAGNLFSLHTHFHLPIFEEPVLILSIAFFGATIGMYRDFFEASHSLHVFLSVFASLFYLLAFSIEMSVLSVSLISFLVFLCVYIPCCVSDIVFPLLFCKNS
jgi:hypothetical protein